MDRRSDTSMNLRESKNHGGSLAHGLDDETPSGRRGSISLDIPFYRTRLLEADPLPVWLIH